MSNITQLVKKLKEEDQDFDYFPTTPEILECVKKHSQNLFFPSDEKDKPISVLDIGSGDGRAAETISCSGDMKVIEISQILLNEMPANIIPVGTDFLQTNLTPIESRIVFSNPPYQKSGGFLLWSEKIIREANAECIYLVIPDRWGKDNNIKIALNDRQATAEVIGNFDFLSAERAARAKVHVVFIDLCAYKKEVTKRFGINRGNLQNVDPFDLFIDKTFKFNAEKNSCDAGLKSDKKSDDFQENIDKQVVTGKNQIQALVEIYNQELLSFKNLYDAISKIPYEQLNALGASVNELKGSIKENLSNLKRKFWQELFNRYEPITSKLTKHSREKMLSSLYNQSEIDFTESNIYAVTVWMCKNANKYFDSQLVKTYEKLINQASVQLYKSNKKVFSEENWRWGRFCNNKNSLEKYCLKLEYRIILSSYGQLSSGDYAVNGLAKFGHELLNDIGTIAQNLGFPRTQKSESFDWTNGQVNFTWPDGTIFMQAKGHSNGNLHLKINVEALKAISIKFGQLKKWIKSPKEASEEMNISIKDVEKYFDVSHSILPSDSILKICG